MGGVLLSVAYDGRPFSGFALQPSQRTVAGELLGALQAIDPAISELRGASRTDAGVHAKDQRVAFDTGSKSEKIPPRGWVFALCRHLPSEIAVRKAAFVPVGYTPRFDSLGKRYRYTLLRDWVRDPFWDGRVWRTDELFKPSAAGLIRDEAQHLVGTHDFKAFRSSADERENTVRTIVKANIAESTWDPRVLHIDITGTAFMHNMVRIIVGTLVDVARGKLEQGAVLRALLSGKRTDAGITAPAAGLCLERTFLKQQAEDPWPVEQDEEEQLSEELRALIG